jgi:hypothetical protein
MRRALGVLALAAAAAFACKGNEGPVAGELSVRLATPRNTDRAIFFRVVGQERAATAPSGSNFKVLVDTSVVGDTSWIAVIAPQGTGLAAGEIARLAVADVRKAADYKITLKDIAAADYTVGNNSGIILTVVKP